MKYYLRLIRIPNLLIIILTHYAFKTGVFDVILSYHYYEFQIDNLSFLFIALSTAMIAAGGNIINDIKDIEIDQANKKTRRLIKHKVKIKNAYAFYIILNVSGLLLITYTSIINNVWLISIVYYLVATGLYFYSSMLKCTRLLGNLFVSFLTALVPIMILIWFYSVPADYTLGAKLLVHQIPFIVLGYAVFALFISLVREIAKDVEDKRGDVKHNCKTIAFYWSTIKIKNFLLFLVIISIISIGFMILVFIKNNNYYLFGTSLILVPLVIIIDLIPRIIYARERKDFKRIALSTKLILTLGIIVLFSLILSF